MLREQQGVATAAPGEFRQLNNDLFLHRHAGADESLNAGLSLMHTMCQETYSWKNKGATNANFIPVDPAGGDCYPNPAKPCKSGVKESRAHARFSTTPRRIAQ